MSLWVIAEDSLRTDELLAGVGAAAFAAALAELAGHQAATRLRMRIEWLVPPWHCPQGWPGTPPRSSPRCGGGLPAARSQPAAFLEVPATFGTSTVEGKARRALLLAGMPLASNSFALGIDEDRGVIVVHQLVADQREAAR